MEPPNDELWDALAKLSALHNSEVGKLRLDLDCARSEHARQQASTMAFLRERNEAYAALRWITMNGLQTGLERPEWVSKAISFAFSQITEP